MAKKVHLHELLELLPAISEIWDDAASATKATAKKTAKCVAKEAKNPVCGWAAVGIAIAVTAVIAYSVLKPDEDEAWQDVRTESTED
jgi:hypothetical protein